MGVLRQRMRALRHERRKDRPRNAADPRIIRETVDGPWAVPVAISSQVSACRDRYTQYLRGDVLGRSHVLYSKG